MPIATDGARMAHSRSRNARATCSLPVLAASKVESLIQQGSIADDQIEFTTNTGRDDVTLSRGYGRMRVLARVFGLSVLGGLIRSLVA